jgi:hypothetical protein
MAVQASLCGSAKTAGTVRAQQKKQQLRWWRQPLCCPVPVAAWCLSAAGHHGASLPPHVHCGPSSQMVSECHHPVLRRCTCCCADTICSGTLPAVRQPTHSSAKCLELACLRSPRPPSLPSLPLPLLSGCLLLSRQQSQGLLPAGTAFDLFRGTAASARDEVETYPTQLAAKVTFGAKTHPEVRPFMRTCAFAPAGCWAQLLLTFWKRGCWCYAWCDVV